MSNLLCTMILLSLSLSLSLVSLYTVRKANGRQTTLIEMREQHQYPASLPYTVLSVFLLFLAVQFRHCLKKVGNADTEDIEREMPPSSSPASHLRLPAPGRRASATLGNLTSTLSPLPALNAVCPYRMH